MKKVLITGAAGFIGSHLCDRFKFIKYDVTNFIYIPDEIDIMLHFTYPASPVDYLNHPIHTMKVDSLGTINTLRLAKAKKAIYLFLYF